MFVCVLCLFVLGVRVIDLRWVVVCFVSFYVFLFCMLSVFDVFFVVLSCCCLLMLVCLFGVCVRFVFVVFVVLFVCWCCVVMCMFRFFLFFGLFFVFGVFVCCCCLRL